MIVDSGDLFFSGPVAAQNLQKPWQTTAEFLVTELNDMGMDVLGLGEIDLALGIDTLKQLESKAHFHFLSANLVDSSNHRVFMPYVVLKRNGTKIGIFSVMDSTLSVLAPYKLLNEIEISKEIVAKLKLEADVIIALTHQGTQKDREFAQQIPGISIIIGGHDNNLIEEAQSVNGISIVQAGDEGKYVGHVHFSQIKDKKVVTHEVIPLDESFGTGDAVVYHRVQGLKTELEKIYSEEAESQKTPSELPQGHRIEVATYRTCKACHEAQYRVWKTSKHASAMIPLYLRNQHLNPECVKCHSVGLNEPGGFQSASHPFELADGTKKSLVDFLNKLSQVEEKDLPPALKKTLFKDKEVASAIQKKNFQGLMIDLRDHPEFDQWVRDRYIQEMEKMSLKKDFIGVQCENCHSPRGLFNADGKSVPHFSESQMFPKTVAQETCLKCHTPSQSPHFNFSRDRHVKGESGATKPFQCQRGVF